MHWAELDPPDVTLGWLPPGGLSALGDLLTVLPVAIWIKDGAGRYLFANTACEEFYGVPAAFLIGRSDADCPSVSNPQWAKRCDERAAAATRPAVDPQTFCPGGTPLETQIMRMPFVAHGRSVGLMGYIRLSRGQQGLTRQAEIVLAQQIARVAHELRTPASGVLGLAQLLRSEGTLSSSQSAMVASISSAAEHLVSLSNDLVDLGAARGGGLRVATAPIDVECLLADVSDWLGPRIEAKSLEFELQIEKLATRPLHADALRLRQVLLNLLSNAVRHTSQGRIRLIAETVESVADSRHARWRFEVSDTGEGIAYSRQSELFLPYTRRTLPRNGNGAGLGLIICRELVQAMGGEIGFESTPGVGSRFYFDIEDRAAGEPPSA